MHTVMSTVISTVNTSEEIKIHLTEYTSLRSEIELYANRVDRTITLYCGAALALLAFCLRPGSGVNKAYLTTLFDQWGGSAIVLLMSWLNSVLLMRLSFLVLTIITMAKHIDTVLAPRLSTLVNSAVLNWDTEGNLFDQGNLKFLRFAAQVPGLFLAESVSVFILFHT